ncbi:MAG: hypothetical protein WKF73_18555 [Nocardioidaceae bacterium]
MVGQPQPPAPLPSGAHHAADWLSGTGRDSRTGFLADCTGVSPTARNDSPDMTCPVRSFWNEYGDTRVLLLRGCQASAGDGAGAIALPSEGEPFGVNANAIARPLPILCRCMASEQRVRPCPSQSVSGARSDLVTSGGHPAAAPPPAT